MTTKTNNLTALRPAAAFDTAAQSFDAPELGFWNRHGRHAVALAQVSPGDSVLDVGCGTGASAIPAAKAVGAGGSVIGVDLSTSMLDVARRKARAASISNVTFCHADMGATGFDDATFDVAISVFSIFFCKNMRMQLSELWRMLKPGGRLVVTVWKSGAFEPFASTIDRIGQPYGMCLQDRPWRRLTDASGIVDLFKAAEVEPPKLVSLKDRQILPSPKSWWEVAMGSGYRSKIEALPESDQRKLREKLVEHFRCSGADRMETSTLSAVSFKPI